MTVSAQPLPGRMRARPAGPGRARLAVCAATIAACLPYLALKLAWLTGSTVGWDDAEAAEGTGLAVANAITMGMDAVAVAVALAFTFRWGRRIPAWLVLVPIWVGAGLLAPIAMAVPLGSALQALFSSEPMTEPGNALQGWVYGVVYTGFTVQGLGLLTAFVFYARDRWPDAFAARSVPQGATRPLQMLLARAAAVLAACYAAVHLYWAFGGASEPLAQRTIDVVWGLAAAAGAGALLVLLRRGAGPRAGVLAVAWTGSAAAFASPCYALLAVLARPGGMGADTTAAANLTELAGMLAGLLMGFAGACLLVEGQSARPTASSTP